MGPSLVLSHHKKCFWTKTAQCALLTQGKPILSGIDKIPRIPWSRLWSVSRQKTTKTSHKPEMDSTHLPAIHFSGLNRSNNFGMYSRKWEKPEETAWHSEESAVTWQVWASSEQQTPLLETVSKFSDNPPPVILKLHRKIIFLLSLWNHPCESVRFEPSSEYF